jgi:hypothetical protein
LANATKLSNGDTPSTLEHMDKNRVAIGVLGTFTSVAQLGIDHTNAAKNNIVFIKSL